MSGLPMSFLLALLAQVGPFVGAQERPVSPLPPEMQQRSLPQRAPAPPPGRLQQCRQLAGSAPLDAIGVANEWLAQVKGPARVDPAQCKALALSALERWVEAEAAFLDARDAVPAGEKLRRAQLGASAGIAADAAGARERALGLLDAAHADALAGADPVLAGRIALDRASPLVMLGRMDDAAAALAEARAALPEQSDAWLISARFSRGQGKLAEAQAQIERAAALQSADPEIGLEAGVIAMLAGREDAARRSWQSVVATAPSSEAAATARGYLEQLGAKPQGAP